MPILDLRFTNVGPFEDIMFEFNETINVFVGPNNCGKSTVLTVIGEIVVYPFDFPEKLFRHSNRNFILHLFQNGLGKKVFQGYLPIDTEKLSSYKEKQYIKLLKNIGFTSFIPALRQNTD